MKIVQWDDDTVPSIDVDDNGDVVIEDSMLMFDLEVGDLIQYLTEVGTSLYHVVEVTPLAESLYPHDLNYVVIKAA